jgi:hypothetical protein
LLKIVNTIAGANVDLQLRGARLQNPMLARISMCKTIDSDQNSRANDHAIVGKTNAADSGATIADDSHWKSKRVQQQADYTSAHLADKSAFLADSKLTTSLEADFRAKR